jgi:transcriptional regulator with XRE-family HTH domain
MKNENTNTTSAPITMNITTDLAALIAIIKQHGYTVTKHRKVVPTEIDRENGMKLRALRKSLIGGNGKPLTIAEFADKIHRHPQYVWNVEKGNYRVSMRYSQAVYEAFRVYPDIRFHEKEKETSNIVSM